VALGLAALSCATEAPLVAPPPPPRPAPSGSVWVDVQDASGALTVGDELRAALRAIGYTDAASAEAADHRVQLRIGSVGYAGGGPAPPAAAQGSKVGENVAGAAAALLTGRGEVSVNERGVSVGPQGGLGGLAPRGPGGRAPGATSTDRLVASAALRVAHRGDDLVQTAELSVEAHDPDPERAIRALRASLVERVVRQLR